MSELRRPRTADEVLEDICDGIDTSTFAILLANWPVETAPSETLPNPTSNQNPFQKGASAELTEDQLFYRIFD